MSGKESGERSPQTEMSNMKLMVYEYGQEKEIEPMVMVANAAFSKFEALTAVVHENGIPFGKVDGLVLDQDDTRGFKTLLDNFLEERKLHKNDDMMPLIMSSQKYVIISVDHGQSSAKLVAKALDQAKEFGVKSIAFPIDDPKERYDLIRGVKRFFKKNKDSEITVSFIAPVSN